MANLWGALSWLNRVLLGPLEQIHPGWSMTLVSLLAGAALLLGFRLLSRQKAVASAKAQVLARLLAIRLFGSDPLMTIRLFGRLLKANLGYLKLTLPPFLILCIPVVLLLIQLDIRYSRRPLRVGESAVLGVKLENGMPEIRVHTGAGLELQTPALRIPALSEQSWRIQAVAPGLHQIHLEIGGQSFTKQVAVGEGLLPTASTRPGPGFWGPLLHPWESALERELGVQAVTVDYPERVFSMLGVEVDWVLAFFVLSLLFAFFLRKPLRVEI